MLTYKIFLVSDQLTILYIYFASCRICLQYFTRAHAGFTWACPGIATPLPVGCQDKKNVAKTILITVFC